MSSAQPRIELPASATETEAAAIIAAVHRFVGDHLPVIVADDGPSVSPWQRAALLEGTGREPDAPSPWGDPVVWGQAGPSGF